MREAMGAGGRVVDWLTLGLMAAQASGQSLGCSSTAREEEEEEEEEGGLFERLQLLL